MGFGKLSSKWKKFKHNVLDKGSLSHNAAKLVLGKKKGTAVMDQAGVAVADIYTFGGTSLAVGAGQQAEAKWKYKKAKKAAKKQAALMAKKGYAGGEMTTGYLDQSTPFKTRPGVSTMPAPRFGPKTDRNLALAGIGVELGQEFAPDGSGFGRALGAAGGLLGGLYGDSGDGGGFGEGYMPPEAAPAESASPMPFLLVGVGLLAAVYLIGRRA